ncbi:uncharacterized protein YhhL (DUF1145 family) [Zhongshania antarctica]|uniref:Uncharacterized protein YhhL (DUF1145 family) n=1 Tax=Zhongshania antarctica TaxID=641702 RepID=A0A840R1V3_9GAMM|nr:DUF1145 domain-containing protein [Zhongshania antarctica]MBB5186534.1 uncharacterized protein YhhL (DUF1145 family) [Zhongshania antarctica]
MNNFGKIFMLAFWLSFAVNFFFPLLGEYSLWLQWGGLAIVAAHLIECIIFRKQIHANYTAPVEGYAIVMLFGALRTGEWMRKKA